MWEGMENAAKAALWSAGGAAVLVPSAWPVVATIYCYQCKPSDVHAAGEAWWEMGAKYDKAREEVEAKVKSLQPEQWQGKSRESFDNNIGEYGNQLMIASMFCRIVGAIMIAIAAILAIAIILLLFVAMVLVCIAATVALLMATGIGIPAAIAEGATAAAPIISTTEVADAKVTAFLTGTGAFLGGLTIVNVAAHTLAGSEYAVTDLVQATVSGLDDMARGALDKLERDLTARGIGMGGRNWTGPFFGKGLNDVHNGMLFA